MTAKFSFFPVGCGDMTLVETDNAKFILIDVNIRLAADDVADDTPDVAQQLRDRLPTDIQGRPYVDAMMLTHPDKDHCSGLERHFHLGPIDTYPKDSGKIIIREMWSSPIVFRRASKSHALCSDAKAWAKEARRRVNQYKSIGFCPDQERILILGKDIDGKTDDLGAILIPTGATWSMINGQFDASFSAVLLAPLLRDDEDEEDLLTKNNSSVIARMKLGSSYEPDAARFLVGGDAEVAIWERIWEDHSEDAENLLGYDLLLAPHHCSWHSLSWDSWSELGEDAEVSTDARNALGQPRDGAVIVASSKHISDDDSDPPCIRAKREYQSILKEIEGGEFICVADHGDEPLEFDVKPGGLERIEKAKKHVAFAAPAIGRQPIAHG
ncbi:metallohydrolase [Glycocaulis profundi]|jgi:hypothetical protein|nr:metallohydrolase [Glycocaulis profundi]